tara:strand:- start:408 stop:524 length:117 start_codon:yes stop_codon:yes gene_type:complete
MAIIVTSEDAINITITQAASTSIVITSKETTVITLLEK